MNISTSCGIALASSTKTVSLHFSYFFQETGSWYSACLVDMCYGPIVLTPGFNPRPHLIFHHLRTHLGEGATPGHLPSYCNRAMLQNEQNVWDLLNISIPYLTILGYTYRDLSRSDQAKNAVFFLQISTFANNFWTRWNREPCLTPSCFSRRGESKHKHVDPDSSIWKFDLRSVHMTWPDNWHWLYINRCVLTTHA